VGFTWDPAKAASNAAKHGLTFEEAIEVFADGNHALDRYDAAHGEPRWQTMGPITGELVVVVWTERDGDAIRIISARLATSAEKAEYRNSAGE
jgi:uncharacterized protein